MGFWGGVPLNTETAAVNPRVGVARPQAVFRPAHDLPVASRSNAVTGVVHCSRWLPWPSVQGGVADRARSHRGCDAVNVAVDFSPCHYPHFRSSWVRSADMQIPRPQLVVGVAEPAIRWDFNGVS